MSWSFRRRIKIAPGVHLNFSKSGISTTFGVRGASITKGKKGTYLNTSIPGTGIYQRKKIGDTSNSSHTNNLIPTMSNHDTSDSMDGNPGCSILALFILLSTIGVILIRDELPQEVILIYFIVAACFFILVSILLYVTENKSSHLPQEKDDDFSWARNALESAENETEKAILSKYIEAFSLEKEKKALELEVENLTKKTSRRNNEEIKEQLILKQNELNTINSKIENSSYLADDSLSPDQVAAFNKVVDAFRSVWLSASIWEIVSERSSNVPKSYATHSIERERVLFDFGTFLNIKTQFKTPIIKDSLGFSYYIYPEFFIKTKGKHNFKVIPYTSTPFSYSLTRFVEDEVVPYDSQVLGQTWKYINKNGDPDRRFSYNPTRKIVGYGEIKSDTLGISFLISNHNSASLFCEEFAHYTSLTSTTVTPLYAVADNDDSCKFEITEEYFNDIKNAADKIWYFICSLLDNDKYIEYVSSIGHISVSFFNKDITDTYEAIRYIALYDVIQCYKGLGHQIDLNKGESLGLFFYLTRFLTPDFDISYENLDYIMNHMKDTIQGYLQQFEASTSSAEFAIIESLKDFDAELLNKYVILLYRFASITAKADGTINNKEAEWLEKIMTYKNVDKSPNEKTANDASTSVIASNSGNTKKNPYKELNSLIGLATVKQEINTLANFVKIQQIRTSKGMKISPISYHCVFTGNPGTGKTTVARIVAAIYKDLGILAKGHLVETDRSGLVAEYVGQTAVKTNKIIDSALDGVLFIDEAYSLITDSKSDYGNEAITTLLKRMEDDRDRLVVILAGYTKQMKDFIDSNPGLQSRFNRYIEFPDYSPEELNDIFVLNVNKYDYILSKQANEFLIAFLNKVVTEKDENFGNGRYIRNIFEKAIENQANRLSKESIISTDILRIINLEDIERSIPTSQNEMTISTSRDDCFSETIKEDASNTEESEIDSVPINDWAVREVQYTPCILDSDSANPDLLIEGIYDARIKASINMILMQEAPISKMAVSRKILNSMGISRVGPRLSAYFDVIYNEISVKQTGDTNVFLWNEKQDPYTYSDYRPNSNRDALEIAPEEISNAMRFLLDSKGSMTMHELYRNTARIFNFSRLGNNVVTSMRDGLGNGVMRGIINIDGGMCNSSATSKA